MLLTVKEVDPDEPIYLYLDFLNMSTLEGWLLRDGSQLDGVYLEYVPSLCLAHESSHALASAANSTAGASQYAPPQLGESKSTSTVQPQAPNPIPDIFRQLCRDYTVGVWGTEPDDALTAAALVEAGARFVNTDLPRSFSPYSTPSHKTRHLDHGNS